MSRHLVLWALIASACAPAPEEEAAAQHAAPCDAPVTWAEIPEDVRETSGVAASRSHPGVFWTHNDSQGDSAVFAIDSTGTLLGRTRVRGASNRDWEDIAIGPCSPGAASQCLFIGDIGDNSEVRDHVVVYRLPEPTPGRDTVSRRADRIMATFPDGPRDAEALFVSDRGLHLVTKGRSQSVELHRLAPPYRPGRRTPLERVQEIAPPPTSVSAQVTAAAASPDGAIVVIRTYAGVRFFEPDADTLRPVGMAADFLGLPQPQGEGVDFLDDGRLVLTGEAGGRFPATIAVTRCDPHATPDSTAPDR